MALDGYGVLRGRLESHHRDRPDQHGRWFHVNLVISAGGQSYRGDGSFSALVSKFTSQSYVTDDEGHPVEVPPGK